MNSHHADPKKNLLKGTQLLNKLDVMMSLSDQRPKEQNYSCENFIDKAMRKNSDKYYFNLITNSQYTLYSDNLLQIQAKETINSLKDQYHIKYQVLFYNKSKNINLQLL